MVPNHVRYQAALHPGIYNLMNLVATDNLIGSMSFSLTQYAHQYRNGELIVKLFWLSTSLLGISF